MCYIIPYSHEHLLMYTNCDCYISRYDRKHYSNMYTDTPTCTGSLQVTYDLVPQFVLQDTQGS